MSTPEAIVLLLIAGLVFLAGLADIRKYGEAGIVAVIGFVWTIAAAIHLIIIVVAR